LSHHNDNNNNNKSYEYESTEFSVIEKSKETIFYRILTYAPIILMDSQDPINVPLPHIPIKRYEYKLTEFLVLV
jgi:hypothetical protein